MRELSELKKGPPEGIRIQTSEEDMLDVTGIIQGPGESSPIGSRVTMTRSSVLASETHGICLSVPQRVRHTAEDISESNSSSQKSFLPPHQNVRSALSHFYEPMLIPPAGWFATKIFHPNVSSSGEICVNTLKKDWKSTYGIEHILVTVKCLLIYPNPESALDEEAGKLLLENYSSYCDRAKLITSVHATPRQRPVEFDPPSPLPPTSCPSATLPSTADPPPTSIGPTSSFTLPITMQKSPPTAHTSKQGSCGENEGVGSVSKERHVSPSPLSTADSNVGTLGTTVGMGTPAAAPATAKAMKRAATGSVTTNAEKRKKALKRL